MGLVKRYKRYRKQSKWKLFGEQEAGHRKLRESHMTASIFSMAEEGKATSEAEEADLERQIRRK